MSVAALVLAAGAGRRFGAPKALVEVGGERLVDRAVRVTRTGGCDEVVVVAGAVPLAVPGARVVGHPGWASGIGGSLSAGLRAVAGHDAACVLLVDQPGVTAACVARVLQAAGVAADALAVTTYLGEWGHPVLLGRAHHAGVAELAVGDVGARPYLLAHRHLVRTVECGDVGDPRDVDRPEDLATLTGGT